MNDISLWNVQRERREGKEETACVDVLFRKKEEQRYLVWSLWLENKAKSRFVWTCVWMRPSLSFFLFPSICGSACLMYSRLCCDFWTLSTQSFFFTWIKEKKKNRNKDRLLFKYSKQLTLPLFHCFIRSSFFHLLFLFIFFPFADTQV